MSDSMSGVFLCSGFTARRSSATHAFCKPVNIRIYSAPPPVRMRVVTYEMVFIEGVDQPQDITDWQEAEAYQSPWNGERSFSFTTGTLEIPLDEVLNQIRRHFYRTVLKGEPCTCRSTGFFRMMSINTTTRRYALDDSTLIQVRDVHHLRHIDPDANGVHVNKKNLVRYRGEILNNKGEPLYHLDYRDKFISTEQAYVSGRKLIDDAVAHFKRTDVRDQILTALGADAKTV